MAQKVQFPQGFLWGAATASYQIEGAADEDGRGASVWDVFCDTPGKVTNGDTGDVACDHYHRYQDDVKLMADIGIDMYRFSIAWPRILPDGTGKVNEKGLDFYERLVDELLANGIQPWATLYHWDLPQALEDKGGWPNRDIVAAFVNYADVVSRRLGDRVKNWMTFNEPWVFTFLGYGMGAHAPGRASFTDYLHAAHHYHLAHGGTVPVLRQNGDDNTKIGVVLNLTWVDPVTDSEEDKAAADKLMGFQNRWFLDPLYKGEYPADMLELYNSMSPGAPQIQDGDMAQIAGRPDFLGVNFYTRSVIRHDPDAMDNFGLAQVRPEGEYTEMDWEVSPQSIYNVLKWTNDYCDPGELYITENGAAFPDEVTDDGAVHDERRVAFYQHYIANCHRAIEDRIPLKGYFAWSLMDNFEWAHGYTKRFGLTYINYETQERILKDSGKWYRQMIKDNGFTLED